eukprot:178173-Chlamydomonas_euryale.AAC.4
MQACCANTVVDIPFTMPIKTCRARTNAEPEAHQKLPMNEGIASCATLKRRVGSGGQHTCLTPLPYQVPCHTIPPPQSSCSLAVSTTAWDLHMNHNGPIAAYAACLPMSARLLSQKQASHAPCNGCTCARVRQPECKCSWLLVSGHAIPRSLEHT